MNENSINYEALGALLRHLREREELSGQEVAGKLNIARSSLSHYETGRRRPGIGTLLNLLDQYKQVTPDEREHALRELQDDLGNRPSAQHGPWEAAKTVGDLLIIQQRLLKRIITLRGELDAEIEWLSSSNTWAMSVAAPSTALRGENQPLDSPADNCGSHGLLSTKRLQQLLDEHIITIDPVPVFSAETEGPWVDLLLGCHTTVWSSNAVASSASRTAAVEHVELASDHAYLLEPGHVMSAELLHQMTFPKDVMGVVDGRSTWAQLGLSIEKTHVFKPGWDGVGKLEMKNDGYKPIELYAGMPICQMAFLQMGP